MEIIKFEEIDSTNTYAKKNIDILQDRTIVSTDMQTAGYGRFDRTWTNVGEENIYMTIILKPSEKFSTSFANLTQYFSVCLCKILETYNITPQIKWPNDVMLNGKKMCGILAEAVYKSGKLKGIVLGAGININSSEYRLSQIDRPATAVNLELGKNINKQEFMENLLETFFENYDEFLEKGFIYIKEDYEKRSVLIHENTPHPNPPPQGGRESNNTLTPNFLTQGEIEPNKVTPSQAYPYQEEKEFCPEKTTDNQNMFRFEIPNSPSPLEGESELQSNFGGGQKITHLYSKQALSHAIELRKNMTDAENILWYYLRKKQMNGVKFRKQSPIGNYIVDFICFERKLIIELDGGQHLETSSIDHDKKRDNFLRELGYTVLRFFNNEVFGNIEGVLECIFHNLTPPTPNPPPQGGRGSNNTPTPNRPLYREEKIAKSHFAQTQESYNAPKNHSPLEGESELQSNFGGGQKIKIAVFDKVKEGFFNGFADDGTLLLLMPDGTEEKINMGEII